MKNYKDWIIEKILLVLGISSIVVLAMIFLFLLKDGLQFFSVVSLKDFLTGDTWLPTSKPASFGILPLLVGSFAVTLVALTIAVPFGLALAIYLGEIASSRTKEILKPTVELLAAIPSVVYGFIGITVIAPAVKSFFNISSGFTLFTGGLILALMALPTIVSIAEDALHAVPGSYKEASLALGASSWETIVHVILPAAKSGLIAAIMLGMGRVIGETMTVLMVTGNAPIIPGSIFESGRTMTATIAAEMGETVHGSTHYYSLFGIGLVLFTITFAINFTADYFVQRQRG